MLERGLSRIEFGSGLFFLNTDLQSLSLSVFIDGKGLVYQPYGLADKVVAGTHEISRNEEKHQWLEITAMYYHVWIDMASGDPTQTLMLVQYSSRSAGLTENCHRVPSAAPVIPSRSPSPLKTWSGCPLVLKDRKDARNQKTAASPVTPG
ncbi:hypothetical protein STEG23_023712 [Scotinomys teguina]